MKSTSIPPNYLRHINVQNKTGVDAEIDVEFNSGQKQTVVVKQSSDLVIKRSIDQGTFTTVDPILEFTVKHNGNVNKIVADNIKGVEIRTYVIGEKGSVTHVQKNQQEEKNVKKQSEEKKEENEKTEEKQTNENNQKIEEGEKGK